jgi:glycine cleavage system H protein
LDAPEIINADPYGDGWCVVITPEDGATLDETMDATGYEAYTE